jgi:hypothetical protein
VHYIINARILASGSSTVAEHPPYHPMVVDLNTDSATGTGSENLAKKKARSCKNKLVHSPQLKIFIIISYSSP